MGSRTCGCLAGILINSEKLSVERCDECALFESDEDAAEAVAAVLEQLDEVYERQGSTVADAVDALSALVAAARLK